MKNLTNIVVLLGLGLLATGCAGSFRTSARAVAWVEPPPPVVVAPPPPPAVVIAPPPVVVAPPPPVVVAAPVPPPITVEVTEIITVMVDDFDNVWDWTLRMFVRVKIGSHPERQSHRRPVVAQWDASWGCYAYVGADGQRHPYRQ